MVGNGQNWTKGVKMNWGEGGGFKNGKLALTSLNCIKINEFVSLIHVLLHVFMFYCICFSATEHQTAEGVTAWRNVMLPLEGIVSLENTKITVASSTALG